MTTSKILKLYNDAVKIAEQSFARRAAERWQELLKIVEAENFGKAEVYVCSGMGSSSVHCDLYTVEYEDEKGAHDVSGVQMDLTDLIKQPDTYFHKLVATEKAKQALREIVELCEVVEEENLTTAVPYKVYADRIQK